MFLNKQLVMVRLYVFDNDVGYNPLVLVKRILANNLEEFHKDLPHLGCP